MLRTSELVGLRNDDFKVWAGAIDERSTRTRSVAEEEAWDYVLRSDGLWIWRSVYSTLARVEASENIDTFTRVQTRASIFIQLGRELSETAYQFDHVDLPKLWEVFAAVQLQLRTLDNFSLIYSRKFGETLDRDVTHSWGYNLQERVTSARKDAEMLRSDPSRSPSQRLQDNLILQTVVGLVILGCIYPLVLAMQRSPSSAGSASDADFWSQITNSLVGLAGFFTLLLPIYQETAAKEWIGTWILTVIGCVSAIIAIPIYPKASVSGAIFCSWLAASCQLLVLLQVSLIASFKRDERAKSD